jgi:Tol biopolymer transport system component
VAYLTYQNGKLELWHADADGSNAARIPVDALVGSATCAPDSKSVLYATEAGTWSVPLEGGTPVKTDLPRAIVRYSPDGTLVLYSSQRVVNGQMQSKMLVAPATGGAPLYSYEAPYGIQAAAFTPDSKRIGYVITRNRAANVWVQHLSGGDPVQLTHFTSGDMFAFGWSKGGKYLAFSRGQKKTDVVMMSGFH